MQQSLFCISTNATTGRTQIEASYPETPGFKEHTTSKDAAIRVESKANIVREKVRKLYESGFIGTADDCCFALYGDDIEAKFTVRPRVSELLASGLLRKIYVRDGKQVLEWKK